MIADTIPIELVSLNLVSCTPLGGAACDPGSPLIGNNFNATVDLPVFGSVAYQISGTVDPSATGTLANNATVTPPGGATEITPGNESDNDNDTVITKEADLSITKIAGSVVAGTQVTCTITASNAGPSDAVGATIADTFPATLSNVSWTCAAGASSSCPPNGSGDLNETVDIAAGESVTFMVTGDLASDAMGDLVNVANVIAPGGVTDPVVGNNSATTTTAIAKEADLNITKGDSPDPVVAGGGTTLTYTVTVNNAGPSDAIQRGGHGTLSPPALNVRFDKRLYRGSQRRAPCTSRLDRRQHVETVHHYGLRRRLHQRNHH